jgi:hypothetical protein
MIPNFKDLAQRIKGTAETKDRIEAERLEKNLLDRKMIQDLVKDMGDKAFLKVGFYVTKDGQVLRPMTEVVNPSKLTKKELEMRVSELEAENVALMAELGATEAVRELLKQENDVLMEKKKPVRKTKKK